MQDQHVRRIHAGRHGGDHQTLVVLGGEVLRRMAPPRRSRRVRGRRGSCRRTAPSVRPARRATGRPRRRTSTSGRSRRRSRAPRAGAGPPPPAPGRAENGASRSGASLVVGVEAEELDQQLRVQIVGSGLGAFLQLDDRIVQELRGDAACERLDRVALLGRQLRSTGSRSGRAPNARLRRRARGRLGSAGRAHRTGDAPPSGGPPPPRSRGRARCRRSRGRPEPSADRGWRGCRSPGPRRAPRRPRRRRAGRPGPAARAARSGDRRARSARRAHRSPPRWRRWRTPPGRRRRSPATAGRGRRTRRRSVRPGRARARASGSPRGSCPRRVRGGASRRGRPSARRPPRPRRGPADRPARRSPGRPRARRTRRAPRRATSRPARAGPPGPPRGTANGSRGPRRPRPPPLRNASRTCAWICVSPRTIESSPDATANRWSAASCSQCE